MISGRIFPPPPLESTVGMGPLKELCPRRSVFGARLRTFGDNANKLSERARA